MGKAIKIIRINSDPIFAYKVNYLADKQSIISKYTMQEKIESYSHFKKFFYCSVLFSDKQQLLIHALNTACEINKNNKGLYLEFGVWTGKSINLLSKTKPDIKFFGFDSFMGLSEDWRGRDSHPKSTFNLNGSPPRLNKNIELVVGEIKDTLNQFLSSNKTKIDFIHIDVDTYDTTKLILNLVKKSLSKNTVIVFDELHNLPGWQYGEYKALQEIFSDVNYRFLSFSDSTNAAIIVED
jgi:hypothetical protein